MREDGIAMKTTRLLTFLALLAWLPPTLATEPSRDPYQYFFQDTFGDFREELEMARDEGKKGVLIFFEMDECPFCHRMKQYVLNQPAVQDYYREHFRIFAVQNQVRATPVFAFFDLEGNRVARYTGATSDVEEFMWLGEFVVDGHYNDTTFIKYKRDRRAEARAQ
jgi:thioredoxin-related protein